MHGDWSDWSPWSTCTKTCGRGQKYRKRECSAPKPINGGRMCEGSAFEMKLCKIKPCPNNNLLKSNSKNKVNKKLKRTQFCLKNN